MRGSLVSLCLAIASCSRPSASTQPPAASASADAATPLPPTEPALAGVMRRAPEPWPGVCAGSTFTKFHVWNQTSELEVLYAAVWSDASEHGIPPMSADDPRAAHARCIAVGPHTAFNPMSWCCR